MVRIWLFAAPQDADRLLTVLPISANTVSHTTSHCYACPPYLLLPLPIQVVTSTFFKEMPESISLTAIMLSLHQQRPCVFKANKKAGSNEPAFLLLSFLFYSKLVHPFHQLASIPAGATPPRNVTVLSKNVSPANFESVNPPPLRIF